jgi:hypothetical protein
MPATSVNLFTGSNFDGVLANYTVPTKSFTLVENEVNYIGISYNSGVPEYVLYNSQSYFNYSNIIPVCSILYFNSELNVIPFGSTGNSLPEKNIKVNYPNGDFKIVSNFTFNHDTLYVELSALTANNGVSTIVCPLVDTAEAENDMWLWYKDATQAWQKALSNQLNVSQYQGDGIGLQDLTASKFVINYVYRVLDTDNKLLFSVLSGEFDTLDEAKESDMITDLPDALTRSAVLVGRFICEKDTSTPVVQKIQRVQPFATVA